MFIDWLIPAMDKHSMLERAHAKNALRDYENVNYWDQTTDDDDYLKNKTIREITDAGLEVIVIVHRYGLSENEAFLVESVLIDAYCLQSNLTNKVKGLNSSEAVNAITLQRDLSTDEFEEIDSIKYMIIKVKDYYLNQAGNRYDCTRSAWRLNVNKAKKYEYVLSVTNGIVYEVYKVNEWHECTDREGRCEFTGEIAQDNVRDLFIHKRVPSRFTKRGLASPVLYSDRK